MLHIDQNRSKKWLVVLLVLILMAGAWWVWSRSHSSTDSGVASDAIFPWSRAGQSTGRDAPAADSRVVQSTAGPTPANQRPAFLTEQEWSALQEALRNTPNREKEQARIVEYLRFQKQFQLWQSMHDSPDTAKRHEIASDLLNGVPQRLANREMSAGEAELMQAALLEDLIPDPQQRAARLATEKQRLIVPPTEAEVAEQQKELSQQQDYKRREAAIVAQWEAIPANQRDQHWLESQLDAARRAAFGGQ